MILKLGMTHQGMELYKVCINHDPGMTLTYFTARSTEVPCILMGENCYNSFEGQHLQQIGKWTEFL